MTPPPMASGDSQERSKEKSCTTRLVPTSAPSMIASAGARPIRFCATNDPAISAVALEDCTSAVTPRPARNAWKRFETLSESILRRPPPNTRSTPERTICVPQTRSATPARMLISVCMSFLSGFQLRTLGANAFQLGLHLCVLRRERGSGLQVELGALQACLRHGHRPVGLLGWNLRNPAEEDQAFEVLRIHFHYEVQLGRRLLDVAEVHLHLRM